MKVLITTDCYKPTVNGVVTSVCNLETELRRLGHEVKILCPSENIHCADDENVYRIGSVSVNKIYSGTRIALRIGQGNLQKLIDRKPDIIHSQTEFTSFIMAKKFAAAVGCPIIHTYHTVYENYTHYFSPSIALDRKTIIMMTKRILSHTAARHRSKPQNRKDAHGLRRRTADKGCSERSETGKIFRERFSRNDSSSEIKSRNSGDKQSADNSRQSGKGEKYRGAYPLFQTAGYGKYSVPDSRRRTLSQFNEITNTFYNCKNCG